MLDVDVNIEHVLQFSYFLCLNQRYDFSKAKMTKTLPKYH